MVLNIMKRFVFVLVAALVIAGCGKSSWQKDMDVFEQAADAYNKAAEEVRNASSQSEVDDIVVDLQKNVNDIEGSDEMKAVRTLIESNDAKTVEKYRKSWELAEEAASKYADALVDKSIELNM